MKLPRQAGSRESRFAQLLGGPIDVEAMNAAAPARPSDAERIARLEEEVNALRQELSELKQRFDGFSKQFE